MKNNLTQAIANQNIEAQNSVNGWIKLLDYGDYAHEKGLQRVTQESANTMANTFHSLSNRLKRKFAGIPIYIGHPDDPTFQGRPGHTDTRAYGWVTHLQARQDGLWIRVQWSDSGETLIKNKHYQFMSARWKMRLIDDSTFTPIKLISIGLTNYPNIPCDALSNEQTLGKQIHHLARKMDICEEDTTHCLIALEECFNELTEANEDLKQEADNFYRLLVDKENLLLGSQNTVEQLKKEIESLKKQQETQVSNTRINTQSLIGNLNKNALHNRNQFLKRVEACMQNEGTDYLKAWCQIKIENPDLFNAFNDSNI